MRNLWFILAALLSLTALAANWFNLPGWVAVASIVLAGVALAAGLVGRAREYVAEPVVLDAEQEATIRRMKAEGNMPLAVRQVQMWFRYATADDATRVVREL